MSADSNPAVAQKNLPATDRDLNNPEIPRVARLFPNQEVLPGFRIDVATYPQEQEHYMAYLPTTDNIYIFGKTFDQLEMGHEAVVGIGALHEVDHAMYFRLPADKQRSLNDAIMGVVTNNAQAKEMFKKFVKALYSRPGANYLDSHRYSNGQVKDILSDDDAKAGLKDRRWLQIAVDETGASENVYLSLVMTEFFAYMTTGYHQQLCDETSLNNLHATELVQITNDFQENYIQTEPTLVELLKTNGGFGLKREVPDFKKFMLSQQ